MTWPLEGSREIDEGIIISEPMDWCKSPTAIVPYRLYAYQREAMNLADSVKQTSDRTHVKDSIVLKSYGDEPGVGGGVISGTHNAECKPKTWSESVTAEGRNVVRHTDEWWMNHKNTWGLLNYLKDTSHYSAPNSPGIEPRLVLAQYTGISPPVESPMGPLTGPSQMQQLQNVGKALGQGYDEQFGLGTVPLWQRPAINIQKYKDYLFSKSHDNVGSGSRTSAPPNTTTQDPCRNLRKRLLEHQQKLADYTANPQASDNLGILGQSPERDASIIAGRQRHLQQEIDEFQRQLEECEKKNATS